MGADQGRRGRRPLRHRAAGPRRRLRALLRPAGPCSAGPDARASPVDHPTVHLTMPQFTASLTSEGMELLVMIGLCSSEMKALQAAGTPLPQPPVVTGIIDTGSNCCCISTR